MRLKRFLVISILVSISAASASCGQLKPEDDPELAAATRFAREDTQAAATRSPTPTRTATPTATGSANAPALEPAGERIFDNWAASNTQLQLAPNNQGQLNLFYQTVASPSDGTYQAMQSQQAADGSWTEPAPISPAFQSLYGLTAVPDPSGRLCAYWSGSYLNEAGSYVYGLFRNCQQAGGAWTPMSDQAALTSQGATFSPARAPDGNLRAVYVSRPLAETSLFYSPLDNGSATPLEGAQLSGELPVLLGRLAIDATGGYHTAWVESTGGSSFNVQSRFSEDGGLTWAEAEQLYSGSADNPDSIGFQLLVDPLGAVHLAWEAGHALHYRRWTAAGGWEAAVELSPEADALKYGLVLAVTPDGLARAAWNEFSSGTTRVVMRLQAAGGDWEPEATLSPTQAYALALAVDAAGTTHVVWSADDELRYLALP